MLVSVAHVPSQFDLYLVGYPKETGFLQQDLFEPRSEITGLPVSDQVQHKPGCTTTEKSARSLKFQI